MSRSRLFPPPKRDLSVEQREPLDATTRSVAFFSPSRPCFSPLSLAPTPLQIPLLTRLKPPVVGWLKGHPPRASSSSSLRAARRRAPSQPLFRAQSHRILFFSLMSGDSSPRRLAFASRKRNGHSIAPTLARYRWRSPALHSIRPPARLEAPFSPPPGFPATRFRSRSPRKLCTAFHSRPGALHRNALDWLFAVQLGGNLGLPWLAGATLVPLFTRSPNPFIAVRYRSTTRDEPSFLHSFAARSAARPCIFKKEWALVQPPIRRLESPFPVRSLAPRYRSPRTQHSFLLSRYSLQCIRSLLARHSDSPGTRCDALALPRHNGHSFACSPRHSFSRSLALALVTMHSFARAHSTRHNALVRYRSLVHSPNSSHKSLLNPCPTCLTNAHVYVTSSVDVTVRSVPLK